MKIAILHYHLNPGGVTTVIRHQVEALRKDCRLLILCGDPPRAPISAPVGHIPGLAYDTPGQPQLDPREIAAEIHRHILKAWPTDCDVLHIHNPTIAKNSAFLDILEALRERRLNLFLQIHDFAEDGRPGVYFKGDYPANCHYGVINSRDYRLLLKAGLNPNGLHLLPNPVTGLPFSPQSGPPGNEILYPVRAIRRKNIGEALLLSLYFRAGHTLSVTLPPNSPADLAAYEGWKNFTRKNRLDVRFDDGRNHRFADLVNRAPGMITTSITEGFGYAFLEAWTAGKPVWGRNLADITDDFIDRGLRLDHLYDRLLVPLSWFDLRRFFSLWKSCLLENSRHFGLHLDVATVAQFAEGMQARGLLDFGLLDEYHQKTIISKLVADPDRKKRLEEINPAVKAPASSPDLGEMIAHNRRVVSKAFTVDSFRERLLAVYHKASAIDVNHRIDKRSLAASFITPERFSLLKWGPYVA